LQTYLINSNSSHNSATYSPTPWGNGTLETPGNFFPERGDPFASSSVATGRIGGSLFELLGHRSNQSSTTKNDTSTGSVWVPDSPISSPPSPLKVGSNTSSVDDRSTRATNGSSLSPQVQQMLTEDFSKKSINLKPIFIEAIQELVDEIELTHRSVGEWSLDHIHSG
jgi:translation initiation factor eIF-2B subunit beta